MEYSLKEPVPIIRFAIMNIMIASLLQFIEQLLGAQIAPMARTLHTLVLIVVIACWGLPLVFSYFRERKGHRQEYWVPMWHCFQCGHYNPPDFVECQQCHAPITPRWWEKWIPATLVDMAGHSSKFFLFFYRIMGWVIYYGLTLFAFFNLRLYSFSQHPLREITACLTMILLLLSLYFFGRSLNAKLEPPVARITDSVAGTVFVGLFFVAGLLWASALFPPGKPLAYIHPSTDGKVRLINPGGLQNSPDR